MDRRLKKMREALVCAVEAQLCDLEDTDTKELGEVVDMIKDIEEALYYYTVTEAMKAGETWEVKKDEDMGRSPSSRRMYMEAKSMNKDKSIQLRELEKYMQELTQDIVEMIADASLEEKQYLEKKITSLAAKVGQMK